MVDPYLPALVLALRHRTLVYRESRQINHRSSPAEAGPAKLEVGCRDASEVSGLGSAGIVRWAARLI